MRRRLAVVATSCLAFAGTGATAGAELIQGPQRVLVVLVTWGPEPFGQEQLRKAVFEDAGSFMRASSYGRASLTGDVTPWLHVLPANPGFCNTGPVARLGRAAAAAAGFPPAAYEYLIVVHPQLGCPWFGITLGSEIYLNGSLFRKLVEHELGHAFGLSHSNTSTSDCTADVCATEYGDPYDTMGSGIGDFNAYEKFQLGWLPRWTVVRGNGDYAIELLEPRTAGSKALVVHTASDEYWIENRRDPGRTVAGETVAPPGVLVRTGPPRVKNGGADFTVYNLLVSDPARRGRPALLQGDSFALPGVFSVTVRARTATAARVHFRWLDRTRPGAPERLAVQTSVLGATALDVGWNESRDSGSGVDRYLVSVDGRKPFVARRAPAAERAVALARPARGRHVIRVVAVDRAGNRSPPAVRRFVVGS